MHRKAFDPALYLVTDRNTTGGRDLLTVVEQALSGGVTMLQLRDKDACDEEAISLGRDLLAICRRYNVPFIINDRVDWLEQIGADGLHIGQHDARLADARRLLGPDCIIGVSVSTVAEALEAEQHGADYISVSPVFDTPTKTDTPQAAGLEGLTAIRRAVNAPLAAIGGIDENNAAAVVAAGADGVAVIRALLAAPQPAAAAERLLAVVKKAAMRRK